MEDPEEVIVPPAIEKPDFEKELEQEIAKIERVERDRAGYASRLARREKESAEFVDEEDAKVERLAQKMLEKVLPNLQASTLSATVDSYLRDEDPGLAKLIRHHFDHSVSKELPFEDRIRIARAAAFSKTIEKQSSELKLASQNRSQISNIGQGSHSQSIAEVKDNILSKAQIQSLKDKGKNDQFIERLKQNLLKNRRSY